MATYGTFVDGVSLKASEANDFLPWVSYSGFLRQLSVVSTSTLRAKYAKVNDLVVVSFFAVVSGAGDAGNRIEIDLPVAAVNTDARTVGFARLFDNSISTNYLCTPVLYSTTRCAFLTNAANSITTYVGVTNGPSLPLAVSDSVWATVVYEAA